MEKQKKKKDHGTEKIKFDLDQEEYIVWRQQVRKSFPNIFSEKLNETGMKFNQVQRRREIISYQGRSTPGLWL